MSKNLFLLDRYTTGVLQSGLQCFIYTSIEINTFYIYPLPTFDVMEPWKAPHSLHVRTPQSLHIF
jgi:hypothetical protein